MTRMAILISALFVAACASGGATTATLTPAQCAADWSRVGEADGLDGARPGKLNDYAAACARGGAALTDRDFAEWRAGWRRGVEALCAADPETLDLRLVEARFDLCADYDLRTAAIDDAQSDEGVRYDPPPHRHLRHGRHYGHRHGHRRYGPYIYPRFGFGIGFGSYGTRIGAGVGVGFGFPFGRRHRHY